MKIREIPKETLRRSIAIVLQDTVLFSDTIRANIKYGRLDASDEEMRAAAALAKADSFIERLPDGYDTMLSEAGSNLSQGQRQLLSIARAVLADPKILILDEATAAMDTETERLISEAIDRVSAGKTTISIAHRLSTLKNCDYLMAIDNGELAELGTAEELLEKKGIYYKLWTLQNEQLQKVMEGR